MKKVLSIILIQLFVFGLIFGATIDSKKGYGSLPWGASTAEAQKAGFKLSRMTSNSDKEYLAKLYSENVDGYKVTTKDKNVKALQFHFYQNKLFAVTEMLNLSDTSQTNLEKRYGSFSKQEIIKVGQQYMDIKFSPDGEADFLSIIISPSDNSVTTIMCDWNVYKDLSKIAKSLRKKTNVNTAKNSIVDELSVLANKLVQEKLDGSKPSFAFVALTTDYKNTLVDNYITDALSEAMFNTGKIKIIERKNLEAILAEQKFQSSGLVNEQTAKDIGMIAGVDFVCYGTLKDIGDIFTVNARVVDVETGEIAAMSRINITKDAYLSKQPQSTVGSSTSSTVTTTSVTSPKTSEPVQSTQTVANNAWEVTKYYDEFGGFTQYIFKLNSSDDRKLVLIYKQSENLANSRVIAGVYWTNEYNNYWNYSYSRGVYDIKGNNSNSITKNLDNTWHVILDASGKESFPIVWDEKSASRWLVDIIRKSDFVSFRRDGLTRRFQTSGLMEKMAEYGITWAEIDAALANEEF